ncbi:glycosyltransferase family 2 protein [Streptomyces sp. NBC_00259]|uniref:glycosyltransferase family 2 protein n=1 Tax=Streptomyces sp. NBC_00259 TaxID=2903643 RepID=UPI002E2D78F4|nr:glycosyltransferase [Streptomyces sp. NBC_00259]
MSSSSTAGIPVVPYDLDDPGDPGDPVGVPDVTVVVTVRAAASLLIRCLDALAGQTIGEDRVEVFVADDGGSRLPERFSVGRSGTVNQALERARGRYLFFLDAGDFLGREALARLVDAADSRGADVVYAKAVGSDSTVFGRTRHGVPLGTPGLSWELSSTKLFRREPIARHGLRFAEDIPAGLAEQAFTLEALFLSQGISVLADYDYRFGGEPGGGAPSTRTRPGPGPGRDIGPRTGPDIGPRTVPRTRPGRGLGPYTGEGIGIEDVLRGTAAVMAVTARFTPPGPLRDGFHHRHFAEEADLLTGPALLSASEPVRRRVFAGLRRLVADHLSDAVLARLRPGLRLRLSYVRAGDPAGLDSVIRYEAGHGVPPLRTDLVSADWRRTGPARHTLVVTARTPLPGLAALDVAPVRLTGCPETGRILLRPAADGAGTEIEVQIPADAFPPGRTRVGLHTALVGTEHPATVAPGAPPRRAHGLRGLRPYRLNVAPDGTRGLVVAVAPVGLRRTPRP